MPPEMPPAEPRLFCRTCGYLLQGLPDHGDCPECGRSIRASRRAPHDLTRLPARWLRRVRLGLCIAAAGWLGLLFPFLDEMLQLFGWGALTRVWVSGRGPTPFAVFYSSLIFAMIGLWIATPHDPALKSFGLMEEFRGAARLFLVAAGALALGALVSREPVIFTGGAVAFLVGLTLATKWCCDLTGRAPLERPAPAAAIPWTPVVAVVVYVFAIFSGNTPVRILGELALATAWITMGYTVVRAFSAVRQSLQFLRDRPT